MLMRTEPMLYALDVVGAVVLVPLVHDERRRLDLQFLDSLAHLALTHADFLGDKVEGLVSIAFWHGSLQSIPSAGVYDNKMIASCQAAVNTTNMRDRHRTDVCLTLRRPCVTMVFVRGYLSLAHEKAAHGA